MNRIKAVVFDLDGVLIDSEPFHFDNKKTYLMENGIYLSHEEYCTFVGMKFEDALVYNFPDMDKIVMDKLVQNFPRIMALPFQEMMNPYCHQVFSFLQTRGIKIAIASSSPMEKIQNAVRACGFDKYLDLCVSGQQFEASKPDPAIYTYTVQTLGLQPAECIAVEDSDYGLQSAYDAGLYVVCKKDGRFNYQQKVAHRWIDDLNELPEIVDTLRGCFKTQK